MNVRRCTLVISFLAAALSALAAPLHVVDIAGPKLTPLLGQKIVLDGYYADVSVPMIVDAPRRIQLGPYYTPAEEAAHFHPIAGRVPATVKTGDHVQWTFTVRAARASDPPHLRQLPAVIEPLVAAGIATRLAASSPPLPLRPIDIGRFKFQPVPMRTRYAVLFGGGYSDVSNYTSFWDDMHATYDVLLAAGYAPSHIYVLYWHGTPRGPGMPVNYSNSKANIKTVFQQLAGKMTARDSLYMGIYCHGGGFEKGIPGTDGVGPYGARWDNNHGELDAISESYYNQDYNGNGNKTDILGVDECLCLPDDEQLYDKDFAAEVNGIKNYSHMAFVMGQCFGGGFILDLKGPNRVLMSAASENQESECIGSPAHWCSFAYYFISALRGSYPDTGVVVDADFNHDGKTSLAEAYSWARIMMLSVEEPNYSDDGSGVVVDVPGVGNSQGTLGASLFIPLQ